MSIVNLIGLVNSLTLLLSLADVKSTTTAGASGLAFEFKSTLTSSTDFAAGLGSSLISGELAGLFAAFGRQSKVLTYKLDAYGLKTHNSFSYPGM